MNATELRRSTVIKYLQFLKGMAEDILLKEVLLVEDVRLLVMEHQLFIRRLTESRWVGEELKDRLTSLTNCSEVFGNGTFVKAAIVLDSLRGGDYFEDRSEFGVATSTIHRALKSYRDDLGSLLVSIESFRFGR